MAARQPGDHSQPHVVITIEQPPEQLIPAIQLEQPEIRRMTIQHPSTVPHIITDPANGKKEQEDAERIVGKTEDKSLGAESLLKSREATEETKMEQTEKVEETPGSRLTVEHAEKRQRRQSTEIMEYIEEQEKHFEEQAQQAQQAHQAHTLTRKPRSRRSPSPASQRQSVGLDHLENLVKLMEQLTNLRDENNKLKKRCAFLESTKNLLQVKNTLVPDQYQHGYRSLPARAKLLKSYTNPEQSSSSKESLRKRVPSENDITCFDIMESCSDQTPKRPKSGLPKYPKRSLSVGSLEQPVDILEQDMNRLQAEMLATQVRNESAAMRSKSEKQKSKSSKWKRVKKVLTGGQKLYEDINWGIRSLKEFSRGHSRYGSESSHRQLGSTPRQHGTENKSEDSGVGSGFEAEIRDAFRLASLSAEQHSAMNGRKISNHAGVADTDPVSGIWMGPPEWIEKYEASRKVSTGSGHSDSSVHSSDKPHLEVQYLGRRQSSPSLVDTDRECSEDTIGTVHRSRSWKEVEIPSGLKDYDSVGKSEKKAYKVAWGKVKDIIHTRKESIRHKSSTKKKKFSDQELSETDVEGIILEELQSANTTQTDFSLSTQSEHSSPITLRKSKCASEIPLTAGAIDMAALLGGLSDEFSRKLHQWEEKKRLSVPTRESTASERQSIESSGSVSQEFQQKLDEWEKIRGKALGSPSSLHGEKDSSDVTPPERASTPVDLNRSQTFEELQHQLSDSFNRKLQDWERKKYRREFERSPSLDRKGSAEKKERTKSKRLKSEKDKEAVRQEKLRERERQKVEREQHKLEKEKLRLEKVCLKALEREARIEKMKGRLSLSECESKNPILAPLAQIKVTTDFAKKLHEWEGKKGKDVPAALYLEAKQRGFELLKVEQQSIDPGGGRLEGLLSDGSLVMSDSDEARKPQPLTLLPSSSESPDDASPVERTSDSSRAASGTSGRSDVFDFEPVQPPLKFDIDDIETSSPVVRTKQKPPPLTFQTTLETTPIDTPEPSPFDKGSDASIMDDTTSITNDIPTTSNIASLERANTQLIEELRNKEIEYNALHGGVGELNDRLFHIKNLHVMHHEKYKGEFPQTTEPDQYDTEMNEMVTNMKDLEEQIRELETFGEQLAVSMESAAMFKWQSIEGETSVNVRLMDLINKMRLMLFHASGSDEAPQMTSALQSFEKLYCQAMQLQLQMNNLRLSHLDRNMEIMFMKRQLVLQEVNNLILQVDITKRQSELVHYSQSKQQTDPRYMQTLQEKSILTDEDEEDEDTPVNERHPLHKMLTALEMTKPQPIIRQKAIEYDEVDSVTIPVTKKMDVSISSETTIEPRSLDTSVQTLDSSFSAIPMSISSCDNSLTASESSAIESVQSTHTTSVNIPDKPNKIIEQELQSLKEECLSSNRESRAFSDSSKSSDIEYLCTLTLPATGVSIPKDISRPERKISRHSRSPTPVDMTSRSEESESEKSDEEYQDISYGKEMDLDFPELIIPDWQKTKLYNPKETKSMDDQIFRQGAGKIKMVDIKIEPKKYYKKRREIETERQTPVFYSPVIASRFRRRKPSDRISQEAPDSRPASTYEYYDLQDPMSLRRRMHSTSSGSSTDTDKLRPKFDITSLVRPRKYPDERSFRKIPLKEAVSKFEQQVPYRTRILKSLELSKAPSPTLHLSRVGILTPVRPLKPAAELWEESQRYRSGHSIYASRILKRQLHISKSGAQYPDKENVSESYVKQIIDRLSKDATPERSPDARDLRRTESEGSSHSTELKRKHSTEFVQHIVHKLSDPSDKMKQTAPLRDLTNSGQVKKLAEVFNSNEQLAPQRTVSDSLPSHTVSIEKTPISDEVFLPTEEAKPRPSSHPESTTPSSMKPDSTISAKTSSSMPTLGDRKKSTAAKEKKLKTSKTRSGKIRQRSSGSEIEVLEEEYVPTKAKASGRSVSPSWRSVFPGASPKKSTKSEQKGGKSKMGTIGVLCQQSMSFDLGVSLKPDKEEDLPSEKPVEGAEAALTGESVRLRSTSSEGEVQPQSPTEKKKSRKFPSAGWLQKPMKLFKVSKCCERDRV